MDEVWFVRFLRLVVLRVVFLSVFWSVFLTCLLIVLLIVFLVLVVVLSGWLTGLGCWVGFGSCLGVEGVGCEREKTSTVFLRVLS